MVTTSAPMLANFPFFAQSVHLPSSSLVVVEGRLTHESGGEGLVGPDLSVDLDESLLNNSSNLLSGQGVLQSVSEEDSEGKGLSELVGTWRRSGGLYDAMSFRSMSPPYIEYMCGKSSLDPKLT